MMMVYVVNVVVLQGTDDQPENLCGKLSEEDKGQCVQIIQDYMAGRLKDPITAGTVQLGLFKQKKMSWGDGQ